MSAARTFVLQTDAALTPFLPRIRYVADFLTDHPHAPAGAKWVVNPAEAPPPDAIRVYYGPVAVVAPDVGTWRTPAQNILFSADRPDCRRLVANAYRSGGIMLYSVEAKRSLPGVFVGGSGAKVFGFDWMEAIFFHLSRQEEYDLGDQEVDEHGVARAEVLFSPREQLHHLPVVDHLVRGLYAAFGFERAPEPTRWSLTHDADHLHFFTTPFRLLRFMAGSLVLGRKFSIIGLLGRYLRYLRGMAPDPYHTFEVMLSDRTTLQKVLYFPSGVRRHRLDPGCRLEDPAARAVLDLALGRGYAIGVHPGYQSWRDAAVFAEDQRRTEQWLGAPMRHTRQHFLHFHFPDTCDILEASGIEEDSTLGYRNLIGFRCGTGFAYRLYNFKAEKPYSWYEKPLIIMDIALMREAGFDAERMLNLARDFVALNAADTHLTLLFHNSVFFEAELQNTRLDAVYEFFNTKF
jgi:hypothetical protein